MTTQATTARATSQELTDAISAKIAEFYPQATPFDMEKNRRLARAVQNLPALRASQPVAAAPVAQARIAAFLAQYGTINGEAAPDHISGPASAPLLASDLRAALQQRQAPAQAEGERSAFEAWILREFDSPHLIERYNVYDPNDERGYHSRHTSDMWDGWKARATLAQQAEAAPKCPVCGGNDADAPCAYPSAGKAGCLRDARFAEAAPTQDWQARALEAEKREAAVRNLLDRATNHISAEAAPVAVDWIEGHTAWMKAESGDDKMSTADAFKAGMAYASPMASAEPVNGDAIAKSKRIMSLIDDYVEAQLGNNNEKAGHVRTSIRIALMAEFEAMVAQAAPAPTAEPATPLDVILHEVERERDAQDAQWGGPAHDDAHSNKEFAQFIYNQISRVGDGGYVGCDNRRTFIKVAALAVAAIEKIDRTGTQESVESAGTASPAAHPANTGEAK